MPAFGSLGASVQKRVLQNLPWKSFVMRREWLTHEGVAFDDENLGIVFALEYKPDFEVNFHSDLVPLAKFCAEVVAGSKSKREQKEKRGEKSKPENDYELLAQFLWLENYQTAVVETKSGGKRGGQEGGLGARSTSGDRSGLWRRRRHRLALRQSPVAAHGRRPTKEWYTVASPLAHHRSLPWSR